MLWTEGRACTGPQDRGTMANKSLQSSRLTVCSKRLEKEGRESDFHCFKPDILDTSSEQ